MGLNLTYNAGHPPYYGLKIRVSHGTQSKTYSAGATEAVRAFCEEHGLAFDQVKFEVLK